MPGLTQNAIQPGEIREKIAEESLSPDNYPGPKGPGKTKKRASSYHPCPLNTSDFDIGPVAGRHLRDFGGAEQGPGQACEPAASKSARTQPTGEERA